MKMHWMVLLCVAFCLLLSGPVFTADEPNKPVPPTTVVEALDLLQKSQASVSKAKADAKKLVKTLEELRKRSEKVDFVDLQKEVEEAQKQQTALLKLFDEFKSAESHYLLTSFDMWRLMPDLIEKDLAKEKNEVMIKTLKELKAKLPKEQPPSKKEAFEIVLLQSIARTKEVAQFRLTMTTLATYSLLIEIQKEKANEPDRHKDSRSETRKGILANIDQMIKFAKSFSE